MLENLVYKTSYLNEEVKRTEPSLQLVFPGTLQASLAYANVFKLF
jgi:hypothetical protein